MVCGLARADSDAATTLLMVHQARRCAALAALALAGASQSPLRVVQRPAPAAALGGASGRHQLPPSSTVKRPTRSGRTMFCPILQVHLSSTESAANNACSETATLT